MTGPGGPVPAGAVMRAVGDCSWCEKCVRACPCGALSVGAGGPVFSGSCEACGRCAEACPRRNIRLVLPPGFGAAPLSAGSAEP